VDGKLLKLTGGTSAYLQAAGMPPDPNRPAGAIELGPGRHHLEFRFTGLGFAEPDRIRFKYYLEGFEPRWVETTGSRAVTYSAVPPGTYRFRVMACNSDGIWSASDAQLSLTIRPQIWETLWFRSTSIIALLLVVSLSVWKYERTRTRKRLERLERQQEFERERVRVARDLHDDLGAGLTEIGLLGALAQRTTAAPERVQQHLAHITGKAREMVTSLDEIVWSLNPKNDSLVSLCNYFCEYAQQFLQLTPIRCRLDVAAGLPDSEISSDHRRHLLLAFKEALTNVVRHSHASEARIGISVEDGKLAIVVADNGQGLSDEALPAGADGLKNLSRRLHQIDGYMEVRSEAGGGTCVRLVLPLPKTAIQEKLPL
jgi:signal transduction histidine kinase